MAGCRLCGKGHVCKDCFFEGDCELVDTDDGARVCAITGYILPEVRYSHDEYLDHVVFKQSTLPPSVDWDVEVKKYVDRILDSVESARCRDEENKHQSMKLCKAFIKCIKKYKAVNPNRMPNMCHLLTTVLNMEKRANFIYPISAELKERCHRNILVCIMDLRQKGYRFSLGGKLQELVCGLIYLLRTGISYQKHELFGAIPEIARCIPMESRLRIYFDIDSKVITSVENEVKLAFRDYYQL